ncbi:MAG: helix-turn-helix transcriptional regulator [Methylotenera sp.]|nr:helix-turn-helix transcriptional regulator [Oligoflexia bacterium]
MTPQEKEDLKRISRVMRAARKISGKNQVEISKALGISQSALSKFESGLLIPSTSQWFMFCKVVGIDSLETFTYGVVDNARPARLDGTYPASSFKIPKKYSHHAGSKVRAIRPFLQYFEERLGTEKMENYIEAQKIDQDYFVVYDNQLNIGFTLDMLTSLIGSGDLTAKDIPELTHVLNQPVIHGSLSHGYQRSSNQIQLINDLVHHSEHYEINFDYKIEDMNQKSLDLSIKPHEHMELFEYRSSHLGNFLCQYKKSYLERFSTYNGGKPVEIEESECHYKGAEQCLYQVKLAG